MQISETLTLLQQAHQTNRLSQAISEEHLAPLAQAIQPYLKRYTKKEGEQPDLKTVAIIATNFFFDGPLVEAMLNFTETDSTPSWKALEEKLHREVKNRWPNIGPVYQTELVDRTWERTSRYLKGFLFLSRFNKWVFTILVREYLRLQAKIETEQAQMMTITSTPDSNATLLEQIPTPEAEPDEVVATKDTLTHIWHHLAKLAKDNNVTILRLWLEGYTLQEIQIKLGADAPSISTIKRRKDRLLQMLKEDRVLQQIARQLGFNVD